MSHKPVQELLEKSPLQELNLVIEAIENSMLKPKKSWKKN